MLGHMRPHAQATTQGEGGRIPTCCACKAELKAMKYDNPLARKATFH